MNNDVIVSLTSWKGRINTVSKTIFSIYTQCNCKIVLTLSEEEFPGKEKELPMDLMTFVNEGIVEILWVKENVKCFKKILYTMDKYREVPIVSADDDCIYTENYVKILYEKWLTDKKSMWTYVIDTATRVFKFGHGPACIYPPYCFGENGLKFIKNPEILRTLHDDIYYGILANKLGIEVKQALADNSHRPYYFHDEIGALSKGQTVDGITAIKVCLKNIQI